MSLVQTKDETGDISAILARYADIRKRMFAQPIKPKLAPPPEPPAPVIPKVKETSFCYWVPIQGPCQPSHRQFGSYCGERDIIDVSSHPGRINVQDCIKFVCKVTGFSRTDLVGKVKTAEISRIRQAAIYIARKYTARSLPDIGRIFGNRDHTTILYACQKMAKLEAAGLFVLPAIEEIEAVIGRVQHSGGQI